MKNLFARPSAGSLILVAAVLATLAIASLAVGLATVRAHTSGPSASGYVWVDSNAPEPVTTFEWLDITGTGTLIPGNDCDECADTVPLPFTFNFFDADHTELDIGTNGLLSFDTGNECNDQYNWDENPIPWDEAKCDDDGWAGNPLIASWFDDLDPGKCGDIYYDTLGSAPSRAFVVQFDHVCHNDCVDCEAGEGVTFETILLEGSNDIKVQYMDAFFGTGTFDVEEENNGGTATTGINRDGSTGLQYSYNAPALTDGLAVLFTTQHPTPAPTPTPTHVPTPTPTPVGAPMPTPTPAPETVLETVAAGGTASTDREADGATANDPVGTTVTSPVAGTVSISEGPITGSPPTGFQFLGQQVEITAPAATVANPLTIVFLLDGSIIPTGHNENTIQIFKDSKVVADCTVTTGTATPDPCVSKREKTDGDVQITVLTSKASRWNFGVRAQATPTPSPTSAVLGEVQHPAALPETGGQPPHGGSTGLGWLSRHRSIALHWEPSAPRAGREGFPMDEPRFELLYDMRVELEPPQMIGQTPQGNRQIFCVRSGTFEGPRIKGEVLPGGVSYRVFALL